MKPLLASFLFLLLLSSCAVDKMKSDARPIQHDAFTAILQEYVDSNGLVDYARLQQDSLQLNAYLDVLSTHHPNDEHWTKNEQLAYWINAYNAFTLQLIVRNYPITSIKDITPVTVPFVISPWDVKFIEIEGRKYDLNQIEHGIIREQFDQPMIHFGLVCAAKSCPKLRTEAYTAEEVDLQLREQASDFVNDQMKNITGSPNPQVSKIFRWYQGDFTDSTSLAEYLNSISDDSISSDADIDYMDYDWELNAQ
ncbi:MAG: DUF547 domain-containing protein [Flavobacteriales bacterium]|nr:DUF547 domain-containing protein [Flavobacteriales bacterium]